MRKFSEFYFSTTSLILLFWIRARDQRLCMMKKKKKKKKKKTTTSSSGLFKNPPMRFSSATTPGWVRFFQVFNRNRISQRDLNDTDDAMPMLSLSTSAGFVSFPLQFARICKNIKSTGEEDKPNSSPGFA
ncbi:hypothetical protein RchiOBHm_Chr2g0155011 [Rosa chinensis]|uniref:Uncharacterized protein n=1 Tax=Rosa chinensis TaxID=74649 RepID=A0A2P6S148_ROSCH|nr:hypothetical protein RchiOBHm_Chr2g0155011 [Rosa chinensis]